MLPDRFPWPAGAGRHGLLPGFLAALTIGLGGCATTAPPADTGAAPSATTPATSAGALATGHHATAPNVPGAHATAASVCTPTADANTTDARVLTALLADAERLHGLAPAELATQITALGDPGQQPMGLMQLALALTHSHQPVDTARALGLFQRIVAQPGTAAAPYKPLARLLAGRLLDQRHLEETAERQAQQLREQQRRIEQLTERLEAMRAIERSLNPRPGTAPATRSPRPTTAP